MIYFIREKGTDNCKIGYSEESLEKRLSQLQTGNSKELEIVFGLPGGRERESQLHKTYESKKLRGEWFQLDKEILLSILSVSFGTEIKQKKLEEDERELEEEDEEEKKIERLESIGIKNVPDDQQIEIEENECEAIDAITDDATTSEDYENFRIQVTIVDETPRLACVWDKEKKEEERLRIDDWSKEREYYEKKGKGAKLALHGLMYGRIPVMAWFPVHSKTRTLKEKNENVCPNSIELPAEGSTIWAYAEVYRSKKGGKRHYQIFGYLRRDYQAIDSKVELSMKQQAI